MSEQRSSMWKLVLGGTLRGVIRTASGRLGAVAYLMGVLQLVIAVAAGMRASVESALFGGFALGSLGFLCGGLALAIHASGEWRGMQRRFWATRPIPEGRARRLQMYMDMVVALAPGLVTAAVVVVATQSPSTGFALLLAHLWAGWVGSASWASGRRGVAVRLITLALGGLGPVLACLALGSAQPLVIMALLCALAGVRWAIRASRRGDEEEIDPGRPDQHAGSIGLAPFALLPGRAGSLTGLMFRRNWLLVFWILFLAGFSVLAWLEPWDSVVQFYSWSFAIFFLSAIALSMRADHLEFALTRPISRNRLIWGPVVAAALAALVLPTVAAIRTITMDPAEFVDDVQYEARRGARKADMDLDSTDRATWAALYNEALSDKFGLKGGLEADQLVAYPGDHDEAREPPLVPSIASHDDLRVQLLTRILSSVAVALMWFFGMLPTALGKVIQQGRRWRWRQGAMIIPVVLLTLLLGYFPGLRLLPFEVPLAVIAALTAPFVAYGIWKTQGLEIEVPGRA